MKYNETNSTNFYYILFVFYPSKSINRAKVITQCLREINTLNHYKVKIKRFNYLKRQKQKNDLITKKVKSKKRV